jgi:hypothetical protein
MANSWQQVNVATAKAHFPLGAGPCRCARLPNWLFTTYSADVADQAINGYYLNGPGSEDPVKMAAFANGVNPDRSGIV